MDRWQIARQAKSILVAATWTDTGLVFPSGSVVVGTLAPAELFAEKRSPVALVVPGDETPDPEFGERPDSLAITFAVNILATVQQDEHGETAILGANRPGTSGSGSRGRGVLEVAEAVKATLLQLGPAAGLPVIFRGSTSLPMTPVEGAAVWVQGVRLDFAAYGTSFRTYQAPGAFAGTPSAGQVAMTWSASPRFDFVGFVLRRASGTTPPATIADGTGVTLGTPTATSVTDTGLAAGAYAYSLFAQYDDLRTPPTTATATSSPRSILVTVP